MLRITAVCIALLACSSACLLSASARSVPKPSSVLGPDASVQRAMGTWRAAKHEVAQSELTYERPVHMHWVEEGAKLPWKFGQNNYTMPRPEGLRDFFVYVPHSYRESHNVSLVFAIHGLNDHAVHFSTRTNLTAESEVWGFVLVYPQGSTSILGTSWNAGTCCADQSVDDVAFLSGVVDAVQQSFSIRSDSIHSMGFSNGGFMSERLGCERAAVFTSIASVSGATILEPGNDEGLANCDKVYASPTSILHVHGNLDFTVPWDGDIFLGFPSVPDNMAAWRRRNKCSGDGQDQWVRGTFNNTLWSDCADGNTSVELVRNDGGGHIYPMETDFDASDYLLDFWNRVTPGGL